MGQGDYTFERNDQDRVLVNPQKTSCSECLFRSSFRLSIKTAGDGFDRSDPGVMSRLSQHSSLQTTSDSTKLSPSNRLSKEQHHTNSTGDVKKRPQIHGKWRKMLETRLVCYYCEDSRGSEGSGLEVP